MAASGAADAVVKIKMIGDSGVGKTSIINRYTEGTFSENTQATIGVDYKNGRVKIGDKQIKLVIWDTAGQDKYRTLTSSYYKGAHAICMVFDVDSRESFENLDKWLKEYHDNASEIDSAVVMLIANKIDLTSRKVTIEEAEHYAKKNSMLYTEVSAKTNKGISDLFTEIANKVLEVNPAVLNPYVTPGAGPRTKLTDQKKEAAQALTCCQ